MDGSGIFLLIVVAVALLVVWLAGCLVFARIVWRLVLGTLCMVFLLAWVGIVVGGVWFVHQLLSGWAALQ